IPAMVLTSVDLPAPLSPTSPTTSPAFTSKSMSLSACTGPNRLLTPFSCSRGAFAFMSVPFRFVGFPSPRRVAPSRHPAKRGAVRGSCDSRRLARGRVRARADLRRRPEPVLDDRAVDVGLGDRHRSEDRRRHVLLSVVGRAVDRWRGRLLALGES